MSIGKFREGISMGLVRETKQKKEHPGYEYKKFRGFSEVNAYFTNLYGENWLELPWAKCWLYEENVKKNPKPRSKRKQHKNSGIRDRILDIYAQYGFGVTRYFVHGQLLMLGIKISRDTVNRHCNQILKEQFDGQG